MTNTTLARIATKARNARQSFVSALYAEADRLVLPWETTRATSPATRRRAVLDAMRAAGPAAVLALTLVDAGVR